VYDEVRMMNYKGCYQAGQYERSRNEMRNGQFVSVKGKAFVIVD